METEHNSRGNTRDVSIYVSSLRGLDTAVEYARAFQACGIRAILCLDPGIDPEAESVARASGMEWMTLAGFNRWEWRSVRTHRNLINIGTSFVAGANYAYRKSGPFGGPRTSVKRLLMKLIRTLPGRPAATTWNKWGPVLFGRALRRRFPTDWVIVISFAENPLFLCGRSLTVDTIVDSWDHPSRKVAGYPTRTVVAWNEPLAQDWLKFQGAQHWMSAPSHKFTYALASNHTPAAAEHGALRRMMYPVATSPDLPDVFADELLLLQAVGDACRVAGWQLLVKPRPEGLPPSLVQTVETLSGVALGQSLKQEGGALDYRLTEKYNAARLEELSGVDLVVSTVTTFGLDAACARRPILQIDLRRMTDLPALAAISQNHHLQTHLYDLPSVIAPRDRADLVQAVTNCLRVGDTSPDWTANSDALRAWIIGDMSTTTNVVRDLSQLDNSFTRRD